MAPRPEIVRLAKTFPARWRWLTLAGLTMSLGWGLRGYIGGGPPGAMIPGAMIALVLCLLLRRQEADAGVIAAFGAVGVGFGGQMTYGQTIGLTLQPDTQLWGLLGLWLKGAIWGLVGGAFIGLGLVRQQYRNRTILLAFAALLTGVLAGWKLINEPKLIYFSNRLDRPREEIWAGLFFGTLALLTVLWRGDPRRTPHAFAAFGFGGGGIGFLLGGWIQMMGRTRWPLPAIDWWKGMEFTFGLLFGLALGWCAWTRREQLPGAPSDQASSQWTLVPLLIAAAGAALFYEPIPYTITGAVMAAICLGLPSAAWHVAISVTAIAFYFDLRGVNVPGGWIGPAAASALTALAVHRFAEPRQVFILLTAAVVLDSLVKSSLQPFSTAHLWVEVVFLGMMAAVLALIPKESARA